MESKICITSDVHFERVLVEETGFDNMVKYFTDSLSYIKPDMFIIAGDLTDSRNLRLETPETAKLTEFLVIILDLCKKLNIEMVFLKGTPSHDGDIVKNLSYITNNYDNFTFVDEMKRIRLRGIEVLFIPELYRPTYEEFKSELNSIASKTNKVDLCVFHGMFDFAISAVKQIDSKHNLSRTVVINTQDISELCTLAIGGHVHSFMGNRNIWYTGRFINERGHLYTNDRYGMKLVQLKTEGGYKINNVDNPYIIKQDWIRIDLLRNKPTDEEIRSICSPYIDRMKDVIFEIKFRTDETGKSMFKKFKEIYNPIYAKKVLVAPDDSTLDISIQNQVEIFSVEDMKNLIAETYKNTYNEELDPEIIRMIELGDEYDE